MRHLLLFTFGCLLLSHTALFAQVTPPQNPGAFGHGWVDISFSDTTLADTIISARVHYPSLTTGLNEPLLGGLYPTVVFGHGFNLFYDDYELLASHLASWGYIVIAPNVQNGFVVDHGEYAREMASSLRYIQNEGSRTGSQFLGSIIGKTGVYGHSMGGGAAGLLHTEYPNIDAVVGMAAAETNPSAVSALASNTAPYLAIGAEEDNVAPESSNAIPMYAASGGNKVHVSITGGAHCKFTDANTICDIVSDPGSIDRSRQIELTTRYLTAFYNVYLYGDSSYKTFLCGDSILTDEAAGYVTAQSNLSNCPIAVGVEVAENETLLKVFPNPAENVIQMNGEGFVEIWGMNGKKLWENEVNGETRLDVAAWPRGLYLVRSRESGTVEKMLLR